MAASDFELDTDEWWASYLCERMGADFPRLNTLREYRDGTNVLPEYATGQSLDNYSNLLMLSRLNFAEQITSAMSSRERPFGFRTASEDDKSGDVEASKVWRRSHMSTQFSTLLGMKNTYGTAYITVIENEADGDDMYPFFSVTSPWQTAVYVDPLRPWIILAAVTVGFNPVTNLDTIVLMRPGKAGGESKAYYKEFTREVDGQSLIPNDGQEWTPDLNEFDAGPTKAYRNLSRVPVVPFSTEDGFGVFEKHTATLDRINHTILQRVVITVMQAFRQRAIDGDFDEVYPEGHERAGEPIDLQELFKAGPDALWFLPSGAKMWESAMADIRPIIDAVNSDLKHLAAATSTPLYVLSPEAANGSAQGASLARETHALKAEALRARDADSLARALSLAFEAMADEARMVEEQISVMWEHTDLVDLASQALAAKDAKAAGASQQMVNERYFAMNPEELAREAIARDDEAMTAGLAQTSGPAPAAPAARTAPATPVAPSASGSAA